jgi:hypothetical protein
VFIFDAEGGIYQVPNPVIDPYRLGDAQQAAYLAALQDQTGTGSSVPAIPPGTVFINEVPNDVLAPYRLSEEQVSAEFPQSDVEGFNSMSIGSLLPKNKGSFPPPGLLAEYKARQLAAHQGDPRNWPYGIMVNQGSR